MASRDKRDLGDLAGWSVGPLRSQGGGGAMSLVMTKTADTLGYISVSLKTVKSIKRVRSRFIQLVVLGP